MEFLETIAYWMMGLWTLATVAVIGFFIFITSSIRKGMRRK